MARRMGDGAAKGPKAEGKIVLAIPPSAELRKELEPLLKQKFSIDAELLVSRGADSANRISSEYNAGVRTIDGLDSRNDDGDVPARQWHVGRRERLYDFT